MNKIREKSPMETTFAYLASTLDEDNYALLASIDLSSAFDVVNVKLLMKRTTFKIKMKRLFLSLDNG